MEKAGTDAEYATISVVSSLAHTMSYPDGVRLNLSEMNDPAKYDSFLAYGQSKLANVLFTQELAERLQSENKKVLVNAVHPGAVLTDLMRHHPEWGQWIVENVLSFLFYQSDDAALTQLYVSVSPEHVKKKTTGKYFVPIAVESQTSDQAKDKTLQKGLWEFSEKVLQEKGV